MGVGPAMSVLGGVAVLALPAPLIFMKYGLKVCTSISLASTSSFLL